MVNSHNQSEKTSEQAVGPVMGFWEHLPKPFMALAPMADVTDAAFRRLIKKYSAGAPYVTWTEFVSADGLCSAGRQVLLRDLAYSEGERPIVAQLFGSNPENMKKAAALAAELGFDGIDINMGCPDKSIEKQGAGAAMIRNPEQALAIIVAAKEGAPHLPISVKTRVGYNKVEINTWIPKLLGAGIAALTVHCRTRKEMSLVPARWEHVKEAVDIRNALSVPTRILGNGDVIDVEDALRKAEETGADGVMIGRGVFGNPWLFNPDFTKKTDREIKLTIAERLKVMVEHTKLFTELLGDIKNFAIMKKHYKAYVNNWDGAKEFRTKLMEANSAEDVEKMVAEYVPPVENRG